MTKLQYWFSRPSRLLAMDSCENTKIKCMFFSHSQLSFQNKAIVFLKHNLLKSIRLCVVADSQYLSLKSLDFLETSYLPCFCHWQTIKLNKVVFVKFSKCLKAYQSCGRIPGLLTCIFRNNQSNIRIATYDFFVTISVFV